MRHIIILHLALFLSSYASYSQSNNVALGQRYTASIMDSMVVAAHNPRLAFDNDTLVAWRPGTWPTQWIAVHFHDICDVDSITFWYGQNPSGLTTQEIYSTTDSVTWTLEQTITPFHVASGSTYPNYTHVFSTPVRNIRGLRITTTINPSWVHWNEIEVWGKVVCRDTIINDTTTYIVDDNRFINSSPKTYFDSKSKLVRTVGGCDSLIRYYSKFVYDATYCSDTISVMDTLIVDVSLTGIPDPNNRNTLKIYPNPAKDIIYIDNGDYQKMINYTLTVVSSNGKVVFNSKVAVPQFQIPIQTFGAKGLYLLQIFDSNNQLIENRKIVLN